MQRITVRDREFELFITAREISDTVQRIAERINRDYEGKNPLVLGILNGAFMFASDLVRRITVPCEISFVKFASYSGTTTTAKVKELIGINDEIKGRYVVVVEDIVDTGITMDLLLKDLERYKPADVRLAVFCFKPAIFKKSFPIDYLGLEIPPDFIVGYGLDYDGYGRNLPEIYRLVK
jgi:hypoxanthine phosphoribosyltransferase